MSIDSQKEANTGLRDICSDSNVYDSYYGCENTSEGYYAEKPQIGPLLRTVPESHASDLAVIYRSELDYLSRCIADYPQCETGGHLFGYWTAQGVPVILYATGPGPECMHGSVECHHDYNYYLKIRNKLEDTIALQHIGDWHSHHQLHLNHPSGGDVSAMLAGVGNENGMLRRHLMCIGTYDSGQTFIDAYTFHQNDIPDYTHAAWTIIEMESPFRPIADSILDRILFHPITRYPVMGELFTISHLVNENQETYIENKPKIYWLDDSAENRNTLKRLVAETKILHPNKTVEVLATEDNHIFLNIGNGEQSILFSEPFPFGAPYYFNGEDVLQLDIPWINLGCTIDERFRNWLTNIVAKFNSQEPAKEEQENHSEMRNDDSIQDNQDQIDESSPYSNNEPDKKNCCNSKDCDGGKKENEANPDDSHDTI